MVTFHRLRVNVLIEGNGNFAQIDQIKGMNESNSSMTFHEGQCIRKRRI